MKYKIPFATPNLPRTSSSKPLMQRLLAGAALGLFAFSSVVCADSHGMVDPCEDTSRYEIDWGKVTLAGKCPDYSFTDDAYGKVNIKYSDCMASTGLTTQYSSDTNLGLPYNSTGGYGETVTLSWSKPLRNVSFCLIDADASEVYKIDPGSAEIIPAKIDSRSTWAAATNTLTASAGLISNTQDSSKNQSCFIANDAAGVTGIKITTVKSAYGSGGSAYSFGSDLETTCPSVPEPTEKELVVKGTDQWLDTGIDVKPGDHVVITATGKWKNDGKPETYEVTGDGFSTYKNHAAVIPEANFASLIGRVGEKGKPFFVGSNYAGKAGSGRLFLQMNDIPDFFYDNVGELKVHVVVK